MAGLSSSGLGSGLDINSLVSQLVAAEKATKQKQITRAQTSTVTTISALASLKGAMSTFNGALTPLKSLEVFAARSATSSDQDYFTASATSVAAAGVYDVQVEQLSSAQQLSSTAFASGQTTVVGTGTLTISVGDQSFEVAIDSDHNQLGKIRDAINNATDNKDYVTATLVNAADGAHLVLSAVSSGAANAITVSQAGGDGGLSRLTYSASQTANYRQLRAAQDARIYVAGELHTSATNRFTDVIDGLSITALKADPGDVKSVTIANDSTATVGRIKSFVEGFNGLAKQIGTLRSFDAETKKAGPLLGDAMLRGIESELRRQISDPVDGAQGAYQTLASIGITTQKDGTLSLDTDKLTKAMAADFDGVARLFGSEDGVAARLADALTPSLADNAEIDVRTRRLNQQSLSLQKEQEALEARMAKVESRYRAQFNALDSMLAKMQSTSSYLSQQLTQIANIGK